jgi:hypothetical protein
VFDVPKWGIPFEDDLGYFPEKEQHAPDLDSRDSRTPALLSRSC